MPKNIAQIVLRNPIHILSFGLGAGLSPVAPGTIGTLFAIPIYLVLASFSTTIYISSVIIIFTIGILYLGSIIGFQKAIVAGLMPFIPSEIFKIALAVTLIPTLQKITKKRCWGAFGARLKCVWTCGAISETILERF